MTTELAPHPAIAELAMLDQWVISKYVEDDKPPFSPHNKRKCSHSNPAHWSSYDQARAALAGFSWLGFVFHESDPYSGIDLDGCRDKATGAIEGWAQRIIDQAHSYTEISPSETGVKIFVRGTLAESLVHSLGKHTGIEVYSKQRYFTVTGRHLAGTPLEINEAQSLLDQLQAEYAPPSVQTSDNRHCAKSESRTISQIQPRAGRASLADVKAQFNTDNPLPQLLAGYGAVQTSTKDYSCPFCKHEHTNTLFIYENRVFSRSPNCKIPQKRGLDSFGVYVLIEHNNDPVSAAKKLNPIEPRRRRHQDPPLAEPNQKPPQTPEQAADAQRKRDARRAAAAATLADVQARASQDADLTEADRAVLAALVDIADGRDWCRPSKEQIAAVSTYSVGAVKRSLMILEARGYFRSSGKGGPAGSKQTAIRTFLCGSFSGEMIHEFIENKDSIQPEELLRGAPEAQPRGKPETIDQWEACEPDFNPADLDWLYAQEWEAPKSDEKPFEIVQNPIAEPAPKAARTKGGASYSPTRDHTAPRRRAKVSPTERAAAAKSRRQARWRAMEAPELRRNLIILSRKADKTKNPSQRYALKEQVAEIAHYLAIADARLDFAVAAAVPDIPPPHKLAPEGRPLTLAMDLSQAPPALAPDGWSTIARLKAARDQRQAVLQ